MFEKPLTANRKGQLPYLQCDRLNQLGRRYIWDEAWWLTLWWMGISFTAIPALIWGMNTCRFYVALVAALYCFWRTIRHFIAMFRHAFQIQGDINEGKVESIEGRVRLIYADAVFEDDSINRTGILHINERVFYIEREMRFPLNLEDDKSYRLYYVPRSRQVLSAEKLDAEIPHPIKSVEQQRAELQQKLLFTPDERHANQQGAISLSQTMKHLWKNIQFYYPLTGYGLAASLAGACFLVDVQHGAARTFGLIGGGLLLLGLAGLGIYGLYFLQPLAQDLWTGQVLSLTGTVEHKVKWVEWRTEYYQVLYLTAKGEKFEVTADIYHLFEEGQRYRLYYTPERHIILSAELLAN